METDEEKISEGLEEYLNSKFPKESKEADSEISDYLSDRFDSHDFQHGQKRKLTVAERLKAAQDNRI